MKPPEKIFVDKGIRLSSRTPVGEITIEYHLAPVWHTYPQENHILAEKEYLCECSYNANRTTYFRVCFWNNGTWLINGCAVVVLRFMDFQRPERSGE
jgi:hypothetical protein